MSAQSQNREQPTPLQFLLTQPATLEEGAARAQLVFGRLLGCGWENQRLLESYASMAQIGTVSLCENLWSNALEAFWLREPKKAEKIEIA